MKKSMQNRLGECQQLVQQMQDHGIYEECKPFITSKMNEYIRDSTPSSGSHFVPSLGRYFHYQLSNRCVSTIRLSHNRA